MERQLAHRATGIASVQLLVPCSDIFSCIDSAYPRGRDCPDFVVIGPHEGIRDANAGHPQNPFVEVFWLGVGDAALQCRINHTIQALDLIFFGKHGDVVLERIWDPEALVANVGYALVSVPVCLIWKGLIEAVVEVLVM